MVPSLSLASAVRVIFAGVANVEPPAGLDRLTIGGALRGAFVLTVSCGAFAAVSLE
jgi:hypothetical protein